MKKEYPTIDGLEAVLKILKGFDVKVDYVHQEIIRGELLTYKKKVLEEILNISKDPVPASAVEVYEEKAGTGVFIFFLNPIDYIEIVNEDGIPLKEGELLDFKLFALIGLFVSKENPEKTQLSIAPAEILKQLKNAPEKELLVIDEKIEEKSKKVVDN